MFAFFFSGFSDRPLDNQLPKSITFFSSIICKVASHFEYILSFLTLKELYVSPRIPNLIYGHLLPSLYSFKFRLKHNIFFSTSNIIGLKEGQ